MEFPAGLSSRIAARPDHALHTCSTRTDPLHSRWGQLDGAWYRPLRFSDPQINFYVADAEASARFYGDHFGFVETFRTPKQGAPIHVELQLDGFTLGVATIDSLRDVHGVTAGVGPVAEVVLWVDDVDDAYAHLDAAGVRSLSAPHDFLDGALRAAWVADPDGHPVQIVMRGPAS